MKKLLLLLAFLPSIAFAQVNTSSPTGFQWSSGSGGSGGIIAGVTLASGCTASWLLYTDSGGHVNCAANMTFDGTNLITFDNGTFRSTLTGASISNNFFNVTGTLPSSLTQPTAGLNFSITPAGSSAQTVEATRSVLNGGYTGSSLTSGLTGGNLTAGTANSAVSSATANFGVRGLTNNSTAGSDVAVIGDAENDGSGEQIGVFGRSIAAVGTGVRIGVMGMAANNGSPTSVAAGFFGLITGSEPTFASAALIADNNNVAVPIIVARDSTTPMWEVTDNGGTWGARITNLTETTATAFARFTLVSGSSFGANIDYCIEANDSTDFQSRCGMLPIAAVDKAGTITCTVGTVTTATEVVAVSTGTLTNTFTCTDSGTNFLDIKANATSSLTQTTLRINYFPRQQGNAAVAFTPQ